MLVNQHSSRWEKLSLELPGAYISKFKGTSQSTETSILRSLHLSSPDQEGAFAMDNVVPKPTSVRLYNRIFKSDTISWEDVAKAEIHYALLHECLELLEVAPKLRDVELSAVSSASASFFPLPTTVITRPSLRVLDIHFDDVVAGLGFFDKVNLPSLEKLDINMSGEQLPVIPMLSFLRHSSCSLKEFNAAEFEYESEELLALLEAMPSLERLTLMPSLEMKIGPNDILDLLAQTATTDSNSNNDNPEEQDDEFKFLPCLQSFVFESSQNVNWSLVRHAFGHPDTFDRRPLYTIHFRFPPAVFHSLESVIEKEAIPDIVEVLRAGFDLKAMSSNADVDLIGMAIDHYSILDGMPAPIF
ncbi:hypothetical protein CPB84DRAFT_1374371 [Gymnopilus junonius]|uniref:Uncharacterized protein n=1 Tax=Gymnopilus junonius TaxID=109634 RepID=A0A9P5NHD4_GYMJU|nr:hypothetical protein CPB84DRAFT_1374371 [Gymnopilus junonius]